MWIPHWRMIRAKMKTVLCYGDSNTYGYMPGSGMRYPKEVRWPGRLQLLLGEDYAVVEEGCNGRTTVFDDPIDGWKNGLGYLKPCLHSHKPMDIVILALGSNDLKEVFHASPKDIANGAETLVETIQAFTEEDQGFAPRIILVSPPKIGEGIRSSDFYGRFTESAIERSKELARFFKEAADRRNCIFFDAAAFVKPSEEDSLHLTAEGHRIMADKIAERIRGLYA